MNRRWLVYAILGLLVTWFVAIQLALLSVPEVWGDEAFHATEILHFFHNKQVVIGRLPFFETYFPLMTDSRHGALEIYLLSPFFYFGGLTLEALRLGYIFWVILIVIMTYAFGSAFFNKKVALLSIILLAVNFYFLKYAKMGGAYGLTIPFFSLGALLCFYQWSNTRRSLFLYLGCLCLGLGFQIRGWFVWQIIGLWLAALLFYNPFKKLKFRVYLGGVVVFVLVVLPVIYFCLFNFSHFQAIKNVFITTADNVNNLDFIGNVLIRLNHLSGIISGWPVFFLLCFLYLVFIVLFKRKSVLPKRRIGFLCSFFAFTFSLSIFTFTVHRQAHLYILFPYLQIIMAVAIFEAWAAAKKKVVKICVVLLTAIFLFLSVQAYFLWVKNLQYQRKQVSGATITTFFDWLKANKVNKVFGFDHPMLCGLEFTSRLEVQTNMWEYKCKEKYIQDLVINSQAKDFYIFVLPQDVLNLYYFTEYASLSHKKIVLLGQLYYLDKTPRFKIFQLK